MRRHDQLRRRAAASPDLASTRAITGSKRAPRDPGELGDYLPKFRKVMPVEYRAPCACERERRRHAGAEGRSEGVGSDAHAPQSGEPQESSTRTRGVMAVRTTSTVGRVPSGARFSRARQPRFRSWPRNRLVRSKTRIRGVRETTMGKVTGFLEFERHDRALRAGRGASCAIIANSCCRCPRTTCKQQAASLHELRHPVLPHRLPGEQPDPGLERPGLSGRLADDAAQQPALDQQFPGIHRPRLPGAVRSLLHAEHRRQSGHHQDDRMRHRGHRVRATAGFKPEIGPRSRPASRVAIVGAGPAGLACAQQLARAGHDVHVYREVRQGRRPAPLRHPGLQDGEAL